MKLPIFTKSQEKKIRHAAVSLDSGSLEAKYKARYKLTEQQTFIRKGRLVSELILAQTKLKLPVLTLLLVSRKSLEKLSSQESITTMLDNIQLDIIRRHRIKISPIGKWFELEESVVEKLKWLAIETKAYDSFFLNLCINYDGQEELVEACRMIARRVQLGKLKPEDIDVSVIKENIYMSNFIPPEIIILNDMPQLNSFVLWDSAHSVLRFTGLPWLEFSAEKLIKEVELFLKS